MELKNMTIYIKEADSTINGGCNDVTEYVESEETIVCTYGGHNVFYVNGDANGSDLRIRDVRLIHMGENITEFECWSKGTRSDAVTVEIPTKNIKTLTCGGHWSSAYPVDMSHF